MRTLACFLVLLLCVPSLSSAAESLPQSRKAVLKANCLDCHGRDTQEAEINLDVAAIDWTDPKSQRLWERVLDALQSERMPPEDASDLADEDRASMTSWIDRQLRKHIPIGGTPARRLNRAEYKASVESLFALKNFALPHGFPEDREHHGFDNLGEGLVLSPPLLEAYAETARLVADEIFPPQRPAPKPTTHRAGPKDLVISYSSSKIVDGAMRLGMKCDPIQRSCTWPSRIEAAASGVYTITVELSTFRPQPGAPPMIAKIFARDVASNDGVSHRTLRLLQEVKVTGESPESFEFDATLYQGQTLVLHWANAGLDSDRSDKAELQQFFRDRNQQNPRYLDAWQAMLNGASGQGFRGGIGWERVKEQLVRDDLPEISEKEQAALLKKIAGNPVLYAETVVFDVFENGPALEVHSLEVTGPKRLVEGPEAAEREQLRSRFVGEDAHPKDVLRRLLTKAFRRPVDEATVQAWLRLHDDHLAAGHTPEEAMHLVLRNVLISPRFLYRGLRDGPLDGHDLATRLSYFLTGRPPSERLLKKVDRLAEPAVLRTEAAKLLPKGPASPLVVNFTEQWLDTRILAEIMPDRRFKFTTKDERNAKLEVEHFFFEMLNDNRPMTDFIDPDFTWTSPRIARNVYGLKSDSNKNKANTLQRIPLQRGGRVGGLLGQSAIMMATANGVDTQPVLRGVWVLENILGDPPPPPPNAVPPITPDTTGAKTPRDLLALHTAQPSCAGCHRKIDPVGLVLENFDPVGRWRDHWPEGNRPIDASATLPDGTTVNNVVEFKAWLTNNIDRFSKCLAEKLMTYATGRVPNYSERQEIAAIVRANRESGNGFRDLLLALIQSETFRTK